MCGEAAAPGVVARRTGFHAVLELLPTLSRGELLNVAFRVAGLTGPLIEAPQELLLQTKARMKQVLRDRPLAEWGEALAPFVAEDRRQGFYGAGGHPVYEGLCVLFAFPYAGYTKTRDPRLDPPVRVTDIYKTSFAMPDPSLHTWSPHPDAIWHQSWPTVPERWPAKPPQNWASYFNVGIGVKDAAGAEFVVRVPYKRFCGEP